MTTTSSKARKLIDLLNVIEPIEEMIEDVRPKLHDPEMIKVTHVVPSPLSWSEEARQKRIEFIEQFGNIKLDFLSGRKAFTEVEKLRGNIENYIGMTQVPTGLIGPLMINGTQARGDFYVPMATSEGALVASYNRGAKACKMSGGITSLCLTEGVQRSPVFKFSSLSDVGKFIRWVLEEIPGFQAIISRHSRHAKLEDVKMNMEGNQIILIFDFVTGDAAGQNMVTICTDAVCRHILEGSPVKPEYWFIESNYSGDKKATAVSFSGVRGKKVTAEVTVPQKIVKDILRSTPELVAAYWQASAIAAVQSGTIGIQGHFANGLTAIFMACGQDVACVSEAAIGITRMEVTSHGDLYVAVTLPNLIVGTVGGGTHLPTQQECLALLGCEGTGKARKFAEICGAAVLAGELSIAAAISSGDFAKAHLLFGRKAAKPQTPRV